MTVVLLELVASLSTEPEKPFSTKTRNFKRVARTPVRTTTISRRERVTGFLVRKKTGKTDIAAVAAQSKLIKMFERNTGKKSGNSQKEQRRSLPKQVDAGVLGVDGF